MSKKEHEVIDSILTLILKQNEMLAQHNRERMELLNRQLNDISALDNKIKQLNAEISANRIEVTNYSEDFEYLFNLVLDRCDSCEEVKRSSVRARILYMYESTDNDKLKKIVDKHRLYSRASIGARDFLKYLSDHTVRTKQIGGAAYICGVRFKDGIQQKEDSNDLTSESPNNISEESI